MGQQLRRVIKRRRRKLYLERKKTQAKEAAVAPIKKPAKAAPKKTQAATAE